MTSSAALAAVVLLVTILGLAIAPHYSEAASAGLEVPVEELGPWPNLDSKFQFDDGSDHKGVAGVTIYYLYDTTIKGIQFTYANAKGSLKTTKVYGEPVGQAIKVVEFDYEKEPLAQLGIFYGMTKHDGFGPIGINALYFFTKNVATGEVSRQGPYGHIRGTTYFNSTGGEAVLGFHGSYDTSLRSIGVYVKRRIAQL